MIAKKKKTKPKLITKILHQRMHYENKNMIIALTGKTGSGKSYASLSICEDYYNRVLKKPFPIQNCVFSTEQFIERVENIMTMKLVGEVLIYEEAGVNLGNLDFQNRLVKMFNYIAQSFRSLNIGLIVNLPLFSMLNKTTRNLVHMKLTTDKIIPHRKVVLLKPLWLQVNDTSGKLYTHCPQVRENGIMIKVRKIEYNKPDEELLKRYEARKTQFLSGLIDEMRNEIFKRAQKKEIVLTDRQKEVYLLFHEGLNQTQISQRLKLENSTVSNHMEALTNKYPNWKKNPYLIDNITEKGLKDQNLALLEANRQKSQQNPLILGSEVSA